MISIWFKIPIQNAVYRSTCWCKSVISQMHVSRWAELTRACNLRWWGRTQHLATWSTNLAGDMPKGNKGICVSRGSEYRLCVQKSAFSLQMSHRVYLSNNLPPLKASRSGVSARLWRRFGLTFRVSLRLISLFSSISSCSLRAAENERLSARTYCINSPGTVLKKILKAWNYFHHRQFNIIKDAYQGRRTALFLWSGPKVFLFMFMTEQLTHLRLLRGKSLKYPFLQAAVEPKSNAEIQRASACKSFSSCNVFVVVLNKYTQRLTLGLI